MTFLLANWKWILIAALMASAALMGKLWRSEVAAFAEYRATVVATGKAAEEAAKKKQAEQDQITKELSYDFAKAVPLIESRAVANYQRMHPSTSCRPVPAAADSAQGTGGADGTGVSACPPDSDFIQRCAGAVAKVGLCRDFIQRNGFPIER